MASVNKRKKAKNCFVWNLQSLKGKLKLKRILFHNKAQRVYDKKVEII